MMFSIDRTTDFGFNENCPPCKNCKKHVYMRTVRTKIFDSSTGLPIIQERKVQNKCWVVEINTIEDLVALSKEVNEELIIGYDGVHEDLPYIEIYNGSREQ